MLPRASSCLSLSSAASSAPLCKERVFDGRRRLVKHFNQQNGRGRKVSGTVMTWLSYLRPNPQQSPIHPTTELFFRQWLQSGLDQPSHVAVSGSNNNWEPGGEYRGWRERRRRRGEKEGHASAWLGARGLLQRASTTGLTSFRQQLGLAYICRQNYRGFTQQPWRRAHSRDTAITPSVRRPRQGQQRQSRRGEQHLGVQRRGTGQQGHARISNNLRISTSVISTPFSSPLITSKSAGEVIFQEAGFLSLFQLQPAPNSRQPAEITSVMTSWIIKSDPHPTEQSAYSSHHNSI